MEFDVVRSKEQSELFFLYKGHHEQGPDPEKWRGAILPQGAILPHPTLLGADYP